MCIGIEFPIVKRFFNSIFAYIRTYAAQFPLPRYSSTRPANLTAVSSFSPIEVQSITLILIRPKACTSDPGCLIHVGHHLSSPLASLHMHARLEKPTNDPNPSDLCPVESREIARSINHFINLSTLILFVGPMSKARSHEIDVANHYTIGR